MKGMNNMRSVERIEPFMDRIKEIWKENQDLRFWQLINVILAKCYELENSDPFFWEEDKWLDLINKAFDKEN